MTTPSSGTPPVSFPTFQQLSGPANLPIPGLSPSRVAPPHTTAAQTATLSNTASSGASEPATDLKQLHQLATSTAVTVPGASHSATEKKMNLDKQASMKDLGRLELRIGKTRQAQKKAEERRDSTGAAKLKSELQGLRKQKSALIKTIEPGRVHTSSESGSTDSEEGSSNHSASLRREIKEVRQDIKACKASLERAQKASKEKEAAKLERELAKLQSERRQLASELEAATGDQSETSTASSTASSAASNSASDAPVPVSPDPLTNVRHQLDGRLDKISKIDQKLASPKRPHSHQDDTAELRQEKQALEEEVGHLRSVLRFLENQPPQDTVDGEPPSVSTAPAPPARASSLSKLVRSATAKRRHHAIASRPATPPETGNPTPLKALHDKSRNSTLLMPEDLKQHFSEAALEEIELLDEEIANIADNLDLLLETRRRLPQSGSPDGQDGDRDAMQKQLRALDKSILKGNLKLGKLIEQREKLEIKVLPKQGLTAKEQAAQYKAFLESHKSDKTRALEKAHAHRLAEQAREWSSGCGEWGLRSLAGFTANAFSFFIGNSIARALAVPVVGSVVSMPVAAFLHVMLGGPIVKQVLNQTWTAPALIELNNYFKLLGASWADYATGETEVRKYASKNPDLKDKLTIGERRAEERDFWPMFWDRYKTEEVGYYAYTVNYALKALAAGGLATAVDPKGSVYKAAEWAMHGVMGWMSGAEYVVASQDARSLIPGAAQVVLPNRATSAAEAAALESLLNDLQKALATSRAQLPKDPTDPTERELLKAIRKTEKALAVARKKSEFLGTFAHEFTAQFATKEATADTLSESVGRTISLVPVAVLAEFLVPWRASGNFWLTAAAHALQALLLIMPPGFTARPVYSGLLRAMMQAGLNERSAPPARTGRSGQPQPSGSADRPGSVPLHDQGDESTVIEVSSDDSDDEGWHGNPTERDRNIDW